MIAIGSQDVKKYAKQMVHLRTANEIISLKNWAKNEIREYLIFIKEVDKLTKKKKHVNKK